MRGVIMALLIEVLIASIIMAAITGSLLFAIPASIASYLLGKALASHDTRRT